MPEQSALSSIPTRLHHLVLRHTSGRNIAGVAIGLCLCFAAFYPLTTGIQAAAGAMPFDNQFPLTVAMMAEQLAHYDDTVRGYYLAFFAVDMLFPPLFSLFFALLWARRLRRCNPGHAILTRQLLWLPFLSAAFDWLENLGNLWIIYGDGPVAAFWLALAFKYSKLAAVMMNLLLTITLYLQRDRHS